MNNFLFLGNIGTGEILIIGMVILLIFGGKKIPELMKGLGKGVKSFKQGMNEIEADLNTEVENTSAKPAKTSAPVKEEEAAKE